MSETEYKAKRAGWRLNEGTLIARGLYNGIRNDGLTDDDVTVWCQSPTDVWNEAMRMENAQAGR